MFYAKENDFEYMLSRIDQEFERLKAEQNNLRAEIERLRLQKQETPELVLPPSGVVPGLYKNPNLEIDARGIITQATPGEPPGTRKGGGRSEAIVTSTGGGGGGASVSDAAYGTGWNGVTDTAPSQNAVYDAIESNRYYQLYDFRTTGNHIAGAVTGGVGTTSITSASIDPYRNDRLRAVPHVFGKQTTITAVGVRCSSGTASSMNIRLGIYNSDQTTLYPTTLIVDAGELSFTGTAVQSLPVDVTFQPNTLYWFVLNSQWISGTLGMCNLPPNTLWTPLSLDSSLNPRPNWLVTSTYGAMPSTFPEGGTKIGSNCPVIFFNI